MADQVGERLEAERDQRQRIADSLRTSKELFRRLVEGVTEYAIFMLDPKGYVATWNSGAERIKGYRAEEIIGQHFSVFYPPDSVLSGWPSQELELAIAEGRFEDEGWRVRKDGSRFWANVILTAVYDDEGNLWGYSKVTRDLTERRMREEELRQSRDLVEERVARRTAELTQANLALRREVGERQAAEQALRESELRQRDLMEILPVGVYTCDAPSGVIRYFNPRAAELWGRQPTVGECFCGSVRLLSPEGTPLHHEDTPMAQVLRDGASIRERTVVIERPDETRIAVRVSIEPIRSESSEVLGAINVFRDVTEHEHLMEALAESDRRKNEFLATLAHELRNPLAPIRYALDLLDRGDDDPKTRREARATMDRQLRQLVRLVDDLLDLSRLSKNKLRLRREPLELGPVLDSAFEAARPLVEGAGHELAVELPAEPVYVDGDSIRLAQVFGNLLNNAAKFTPKGGRVSVIVESESGEVTVRVGDTGVGIEAGHLPRLFEMFSQASPSLERSEDGLGIGLALVRALVELHDGSVEARSAGLGKGSEFVVRLHTCEPPAAEPTGSEVARERVAGEPMCRVLIADDNPDAVDALATLLQLAGHQVATAHDGREALEVAVSFLPDVVMLDIGMPGMNGYEAARLIREEPWSHDVVLVAITGWGQEGDKQQAREAGFDHHLTKPVDMAGLETLLAAVPCRDRG
ncbi:MAG TPA: PAS domain S-box protein [Thermoanaerobaculia bacterium]|nr:PAS domain S-box protein [Thermoanaerobaculia bacterium]